MINRIIRKIFYKMKKIYSLSLSFIRDWEVILFSPPVIKKKKKKPYRVWNFACLVKDMWWARLLEPATTTATEKEVSFLEIINWWSRGKKEKRKNKKEIRKKKLNRFRKMKKHLMRTFPGMITLSHVETFHYWKDKCFSKRRRKGRWQR